MLVLLLLMVSPQKITRPPHIPPRDIVAVAYSDNPIEEKPKDKKPDNKESYLHRVFEPDVFPLWIGSAAAIVAGFVGVVTLRKISKQTSAAIETAKAAELSARTGYTTQLPKLAIFKCQISGGGPYKDPFLNLCQQPTVAIAITNWGGTLAFVIKWSVNIVYEQETAEIVTDQPFGVVIKPHEEKWLPSVQAKDYLSIPEISRIRSGSSRYFVSGQVLYEDLFGNRNTFNFCRHLGYWNDEVAFKECENEHPQGKV